MRAKASAGARGRAQNILTVALVASVPLALTTVRISTFATSHRSPGLLPRLVLLLVWLLAAATIAVPSPAFAADETGPTTTASAVLDSRAASYLDQLLGEINTRRARAGSPPVVYAGTKANQAVGQYLADLTPMLVAMHACFHGDGNLVAPGWDYVTGSGFQGEARGEVLACPDDQGRWTAAKIADGWWSSSTHREILYADASATAVACGTYGPRQGGRAYQTIACVTYKIEAR
jgi:hypothetical protein